MVIRTRSGFRFVPRRRFPGAAPRARNAPRQWSSRRLLGARERTRRRAPPRRGSRQGGFGGGAPSRPGVAIFLRGCLSQSAPSESTRLDSSPSGFPLSDTRPAIPSESA